MSVALYLSSHLLILISNQTMCRVGFCAKEASILFAAHLITVIVYKNTNEKRKFNVLSKTALEIQLMQHNVTITFDYSKFEPL